jgi:hypothetical protein
MSKTHGIVRVAVTVTLLIGAVIAPATAASLMGLAPGEGLGTPVAAPQPADVATHRALYAMRLHSASSASGVLSARGVMALEWADACDGWIIEQRYRLTLEMTEDRRTEIGINFATWESKDGTRYRFFVRKLNEGEEGEELRGSAHLSKDGKRREARFTQPRPTVVPLPTGTMFPTAHTFALIAAAQGGQKILSRPVFDGGEVEGAMQVTAAIGKRVAPDPKAKDPLLRGPAWDMRLAFYKLKQPNPEPDYEIATRIHANGVAETLSFDYGGFVVRGTLDKLERLPKPVC